MESDQINVFEVVIHYTSRTLSGRILVLQLVGFHTQINRSQDQGLGIFED